MMMMWLSNNRQFLFLDPSKHEYILRIIGSDMFEYFKRAGLDEMTVPPEAMTMIGDIIQSQDGNMNDGDLNQLYESAKMPKYPVFSNPKEKNPEKLEYKPKMRLNDMEDGAELSIVPEDLSGMYDYVPSVVSMQAGADQVLMEARANAINTMKDPTILQLLAGQGVKPLIKDLLVDTFNGGGLPDAEKYFETISNNVVQSPNGQAQGGISGGNGLGQPLQEQGVPNPLAPQAPQGLTAGMAGPTQVPVGA